jgi:hypothetical protein
LNFQAISEAASHFVYGWMPTILNLDLSKKEQVLGLLNKVKNEDYAVKD